ncbi:MULTISPECIES: rod shape-determining protein MreC [Olivibacter]|jgi:rod shape-determining protein MreC|uniref:Cell shape-determining protein MreC n=2 Tax=Sphingobacteriaceae TaxID=84566 RepID=F4CDQ2_SPHS2|nr:rod shape-determining protein MreC [Olivibacter sp. UJ_SKK_5.1]MDX3915873.1 rod shape-determining protein MreC [Pseudosphingobacterium sp.]
MRNLWIFISKYNNFFLFILFFSAAVALIVKNNGFQRASALNSSNTVIGGIYQKIDNFTQYLNLKQTNKDLSEENAYLRSQLKSSLYSKLIEQDSVLDSLGQTQYTYIVARVINNSIHQKNNYLTINRGSEEGIVKGMGVISSHGIVGIVLNVSPHFATIQSLLHADTRVSASLANSNAFGSLVWGTENFDSRKAILKDIPNHVKVRPGEEVVTSGYSLFPPGISIGRVIKTGKSGDSFLDIEVKLNNDFNTLQYVYVIKDQFASEKRQLEGDTIATNE